MRAACPGLNLRRALVSSSHQSDAWHVMLLWGIGAHVHGGVVGVVHEVGGWVQPIPRRQRDIRLPRPRARVAAEQLRRAAEGGARLRRRVVHGVACAAVRRGVAAALEGVVQPQQVAHLVHHRRAAVVRRRGAARQRAVLHENRVGWVELRRRLRKAADPAQQPARRGAGVHVDERRGVVAQRCADREAVVGAAAGEPLAPQRRGRGDRAVRAGGRVGADVMAQHVVQREADACVGAAAGAAIVPARRSRVRCIQRSYLRRNGGGAHVAGGAVVQAMKLDGDGECECGRHARRRVADGSLLDAHAVGWRVQHAARALRRARRRCFGGER